MIELTNSVAQTIAPNATAAFDTVVSKSGRDVCHRCGSGIVQLEGHGTHCNPARYSVTITGNISSTEAGSVPAVAVSVNGETLAETVRTATVTAAGDVFPFAATTSVRECGSCCDSISLRNVGTVPAVLTNLSFIVRRTA